MRGLNLFTSQALSKIGESTLVLLALIVLLFLFKNNSYLIYVFSLFFGTIGLIFFYFNKIKKYLSFRHVGKDALKKVVSYSKYGLVGGVIGIILQSLDKVYVNKLIGSHELGIYMAYYTISIILISQLIQIFVNVFFPSVSKTKDKRNILNKINSLFKRGFVIVVIASTVLIRILLSLFGPEYPIVWDWIIMLSLYGTINFFVSMYGWLLVSISEKGYKRQNAGLIVGIFAYILSVFIGYYVIGFSIDLLLISFIINRTISGLFYYFNLNKILILTKKHEV